MSRVYNFSAGPSMLPVPVLEKAAGELLEYGSTGQLSSTDSLHPEVLSLELTA